MQEDQPEQDQGKKMDRHPRSFANTEKFVADWHYFLLEVQEVLYGAADAQLIKNLNLYVVNRFYLKPYEKNQDFYEQFEERLKEGRQLLSLA